MRVPQSVLDCVVYLYENDDLLGTGYCVGVPEAPGSQKAWTYVVTAQHVVDGISSVLIRVNALSGEAVYIPADKWWYSHNPHADVAIAYIPPQPDFLPTVIRLDQIANDEFLVKRNVGPGDEVVFAGLFQRSPGESRNLPIVRFGNIARMNEELVPTRGPSGATEEIDAIMVEARSWGGHSGSPAIVLFPPDRWMNGFTYEALPVDEPRRSWAVLGLVSSHWDLPSPIKQKNVPRGKRTKAIELEAMVNAGIALVVPGQHILDLLFRDDVVSYGGRRSQDVKDSDFEKRDG